MLQEGRWGAQAASPSLVLGGLLLISPARAPKHSPAWVCSAAAETRDFYLPQGMCSATCSPTPLSPRSPGILHPLLTPSMCSQASLLPVLTIYASIFSR